MKFKEFLKENEDSNYLEVKIGDIKAVLDGVIDDPNINVVEVRNRLTNVAESIKSLVHSGDKNKKALKILQVIGVNIFKDVEKGSNLEELKETIKNYTQALNDLMSESGLTINKINKKHTEGLPEPYSIKKDLYDRSKFLRTADDLDPTSNTGVDDNAAPLSGGGQGSFNVL